MLFNNLNLPGSQREFERAIQLNPNYAFAHYVFGFTVLPALGQIDLAIAEIRHGLDLDPFSVIINANCGYAYILARRYPDANCLIAKKSRTRSKLLGHP